MKRVLETRCDMKIAKNMQCTIKSNVRNDLNIEVNDIIFVEVYKVIDKNGKVKYDKEPE